MAKKKGLRVYLVVHRDGRLTGILIRRWDRFLFDVEPPSAYGNSEAEVLAQLETILRERALSGDDPLQRYLWDEAFGVRRVDVEVYPQSVVNKQPVIGRRRIPLRLHYAWTRLGAGEQQPYRGDEAPTGGDDGPRAGAYKVMLPRFGWWMILEDLDTAAEALRNAISATLLGEHPRWIFDFSQQAEEYVREWPLAEAFLHRPASDQEQSEAAALRERFPTLAQVAEEMVERAVRRKLPPSVGPSALQPDHLSLIDSDPLPSLLLVGAPGAGKSTWVRQLAQHLAARRRAVKRSEQPPLRIWRTSGDRIIAGMVYLGQWQQRCFDIVSELKEDGDFLYVDQLSSILKQQSDGACVADLLLPAMAADEISLIAECSEDELERCRRRAPALLARFEVIRLFPTPQAQMAALLQTYLERKAPWLSIHPLGLRRLVQYLAAFSRHQAFPGKGFTFIDWLAQQRPARADGAGQRLLSRDVSAAFAEHSGLPLQLIADDEAVGSSTIGEALRAAVVGQDRACEICARVLTRFKAGTNDPERPVGTLLFVGPTGVGKTELAKQLTRYMFGDEGRMVRLDMSELSAPGSVSRLLQVGEGVTSLAERVRQQPLSLVLLDEIEKAHPEVFDLLLGVLGEGRLTDALGRLVDCRMTLIVMTSNLGAAETLPAGFGQRAKDDYLTHVRQHFRPEFFNRLDHVVVFSPLTPADIERIVDLELTRAAGRAGLRRRRLRLRVDASARARLAALGHHPTRGARPLKRVIEELVITPLAVRLAAEPQLSDRDIWILHRDGGASVGLDRIPHDEETILI